MTKQKSLFGDSDLVLTVLTRTKSDLESSAKELSRSIDKKRGELAELEDRLDDVKAAIKAAERGAAKPSGKPLPKPKPKPASKPKGERPKPASTKPE